MCRFDFLIGVNERAVFDAALWLFSVSSLYIDFNSIMFQIFMDGQKYSNIYKKKMLKINLQQSN